MATSDESKNRLLSHFDDSVESINAISKPKLKLRAYLPTTIPWIISITLLLYMIYERSRDCSCQGYWRKNEFQTISRQFPAKLKDVFFDTTLKFNESHKLYRPITEPAYVGIPTPEIDAAWEELNGAVNIFVTPDEQPEVGDNMWLDPETGLYMAQVTVFHNIHCLNLIRQTLYLDDYPELNDYTLKPHVEHCIDSLRLSLMCTSDMTLIPIEWSENRNWIMPRFERTYTCRDYESLRQWSVDRDAADPKRYPKNAERLRSENNIKLEPVPGAQKSKVNRPHEP